MFPQKLLKRIALSVVFAFCLVCPSHALTDIEIRALEAQAKKMLSAGNVDEAIQTYHDLVRKGASRAADDLSKIYNNRKQDYIRAGLWCFVALENFASENANCGNLSFAIRLRENEQKNLRRLAVQCIATNYRYCDELSTNFERDLDFYYSKYCTVADPKDTSFNLREKPNGKLIRDFPNGETVIKKEIASDSNGKQWVLIADDFYGFTLGWVSANFVKCNTRKRL